MSRNGEPIQKHGLKHAIETGIEYTPLVDGVVPEFEEREAAVYCHYTPRDFYDLPVEERARAVAQYRLHRVVETHAEDAVVRAIELKAAIKGSRRGGR